MGKITLYPKGSEWRKWDLQVHTPNTKMSDCYLPKSDKGMEKFVNVLAKSDVSVFGISDYFSIDGYLDFIKTAKETDPNIFVTKSFFPNAEFRLDVKTNKEAEEIHFHVLFDNSEEVLNRIPSFFSKLELTTKRTTGSRYLCIESDLKEVGYDSAMVSMESLETALTAVFGTDKCYLKIAVVSGSGSNRASKKSSKRNKTTHDEIDIFSDAFFGKSTNQAYYIDINRQTNKRIVRPKPVFSTSDCHSFEDCTNFLGKEFLKDGIQEKEITWVKSDMTFEGLRQTLFEPETRIKIQSEKPEEKKSYLIIDKLKFIDNSGMNIFQDNEIELNPNLNVIIGGRSTGKSMLLYYAAKTIDRDEVERRFNDVPPIPKYEEETKKEMELSDFNFEVIWADKTVNHFNEISNEHRKILYIPQNYLSSLAGIGPEKKIALNDFIFDVIMQNETIKSDYEIKINDINLIKEKVSLLISNYFSLKNDVDGKRKNVEEIGDLVGINKYISEVKSKIDVLKKESGLTKQQIDELKVLLDDQTKLKKEADNIQHDWDNSNQLFENIKSHIQGMQKVISEGIEYINDEEIKQLINKKTDWSDKMLKYVEKSLSEVRSKLYEKRKKNTEELKVKDEKISPLISLVKKQKEVQILMDLLKTEEGKVSRIELLKEEIKTSTSKLSTTSKNILGLYQVILKTYRELQVILKKGEPQLDDIKLSVKVKFNEKDFNENCINSYINRHDIKKILPDSPDQFYYVYDEKTHFDKIFQITEGLVSGILKPLNFRQPEEALRSLLDNYWGLDYSVTYEGDTLDSMSPGKMSLTLLKLLILLRNDSYPIFIDQPEADLDNRSVYTELVQYIKRRKVERQILLVTHNPNLVVGADAELVVVANQGKSENELFQFEYVTGSLENTLRLDKKIKGVLFNIGIREHICEILEGGEEAFKKREEKYNFHS